MGKLVTGKIKTQNFLIDKNSDPIKTPSAISTFQIVQLTPPNLGPQWFNPSPAAGKPPRPKLALAIPPQQAIINIAAIVDK